MTTLRTSIKVDVQVQGAARVAGITKELERSAAGANKLAQMELRLHQATAQRQRANEQAQFRLMQGVSKIAAQQEAAESKRAAAATKQAAREDSIRQRMEAAEAKKAARADALLQKQAAREQSVRGRQLALIERNEQRAAVAAERRAERERKALVTVESEMTRLQKLQERRAATAQARANLGMPPVGTGGSFMTGHGFLNRGRQALGVARDLSVAGWGLYGAATMGAGMVGSVFEPARQFESSMADVRNKGGFSIGQTAEIAAIAKQMGRTTQFSATQSASAAVELAAAGLGAPQIKKALPSTLQFAQASGLGTEQSSALLVESMSQFGLKADDFQHIGDVMVSTANKSTISVADLGESLKYVGPISAAAGQSIEETSAAIGFLGERGIKASQAGTALRTIFASLVKPAKQAKDALHTLGIGEKDLQKGLSDLPKFFDDLAAKMDKKGLSKESRLKIMKQLFGNEGMTAAVTLMGGTQAWRDFVQQVKDSTGAMQGAADVAGNTLDGKMKKLDASVENAKITLAERFTPALTEKVIPGLTEAALKTGDWIEKHETLTKLLGGATVAGAGAWAVSVVPGVAPLTSALAGGMGTALAAPTLTAAVTAGGASLAGTLMLAMASGIAGYSLSTAVAKSLAGVDSDEDLAVKINDILFGKRTDQASGRGMGANKSVADVIADKKRAREAGPQVPVGPLSGAELDRIDAQNQRNGFIKVGGGLVIDVRYGKPPRIEEITATGIPLRVGVNNAAQ